MCKKNTDCIYKKDFQSIFLGFKFIRAFWNNPYGESIQYCTKVNCLFSRRFTCVCLIELPEYDVKESYPGLTQLSFDTSTHYSSLKNWLAILLVLQLTFSS